MSGGVRAGVVVFAVGLLFIWLIRPIGNACSDLDKLPSGSVASSAPSFAPPFTRTCTYTTPEGTKARRRYVPALDLLALLLVAVIVGGAIGLAGPGGRERASKPPHKPKPPEPERSEQWETPLDAQPPAADEEQARRDRDAAERERARLEREARRQS
ncbi:MAG TPA: hypothetical protein VNA28_05370 [Solirubrobacteraceae bacterium]|nr:hypothetical protein [Solirubrobacteraceae bacterium]